MRDLKFRVWDGKEKIMAYSDHIDYSASGADSRYLCQKDPKQQQFEKLSLLFNTQLWGKNWQHSVIQQYTGIKDKNSKEIFEGDVVKWRHPMEDVGEVKYVVNDNVEVNMCFYGVNVKRLGGVCQFQSDDEYEVIGNIYENPELLK